MLNLLTNAVFLIAFPIALYALLDSALRLRERWLKLRDCPAVLASRDLCGDGLIWNDHRETPVLAGGVIPMNRSESGCKASPSPALIRPSQLAFAA